MVAWVTRLNFNAARRLPALAGGDVEIVETVANGLRSRESPAVTADRLRPGQSLAARREGSPIRAFVSLLCGKFSSGPFRLAAPGGRALLRAW
jgi:hypothetical protein